MRKSILFCFMLCGCSYRYDLGRFEPATAETPAPVVVPTSTKIIASPCEEAGVKTTSLQVTTKLDESNQTVTTNAVTETHETPSKPCQ